MRFLKLLNKKSITKHLDDHEEFIQNKIKVKEVIQLALNNYAQQSCACAYPRFQQIIGVDCTKSNNSYFCYETEYFIKLSRVYFLKENSLEDDECTNEKWICKKCNSVYEFGWSDFSIHIDRAKLQLIDLKVEMIGKPVERLIPVYMGLIGHSYPNPPITSKVAFVEFKKYVLEE